MSIKDEIMARLADAIENGKPFEGLLFHGTCETIEGPLKPGGDEVFWTSDSPVIAQQYIPNAGVELMCSMPLAYEMEGRVRPNFNSALYKIACELSGKQIDDYEVDKYGQISSWSIPRGWPTNGEVIEHIEKKLGYKANSNGAYWLKAVLENGKERIMPAEWQMDGRLYVTLADGLNLKDVRLVEEPDLTLYEHNNVHAFMQAEEEGYDGVIINDFAQTTNFGNLGHRSYGLNQRGLSKVEWIWMPAKRFELATVSPFPLSTPDLNEWFEAQALAVPAP